MFYRRNFKKYHAFTLQPCDRAPQTSIADLQPAPAELTHALRDKFPEFFVSSSQK